MVRRHAALTALGLLAATVLAGCSSSDPATLPTAVDYETAQYAWSDPWLAPEVGAVPEAAWGSPEGYVRREAGTRTTTYLGGTDERVLLREVDAAQAAGWTLTGATCGTDPTASFAKDAMTAVASAVEAGRGVEVEVTAYVRHHLDQSWPGTAPIRRSCLRGGGVAALQVPDELPLGPPYDGVEDPPEPDSSEWQRDTRTDDEQALLDAVNADEWVTGLGLTLASELAADDALRRAPTGTTTVDQPLAEVLAAMTGWQVTWVSCGRDREAEASARLVTDAGVAVARLGSDGSSTEVTVTAPVPETPDPAWVADVPVLEDPTCSPRGNRILTRGTPVTLVGESQPVVD